VYVNTYVLEKLVNVWLAERRAEAARLALIESAASPAPPKEPRAIRWIQVQFGR
jgi:hypothetical protein